MSEEELKKLQMSHGSSGVSGALSSGLSGLLSAAGELAKQRVAHEQEKMRLTQQGLSQSADGASALARGQGTALDRLMDVYKTALVR